MCALMADPSGLSPPSLSVMLCRYGRQKDTGVSHQPTPAIDSPKSVTLDPEAHRVPIIYPQRLQ